MEEKNPFSVFIKMAKSIPFREFNKTNKKTTQSKQNGNILSYLALNNV